jgi:hypothetical protein
LLNSSSKQQQAEATSKQAAEGSKQAAAISVTQPKA